MTYHPHALLLDEQLDRVLVPVEIYLHDWMHVIFVDGIMNLVLHLLLEVFIQQGIGGVYE